MIQSVRAWDDDTLSMRWVKAMVLEDGEFNRVIFVGDDVKCGYNLKCSMWRYVHKTKLMQSTGAKDMHGISLYEGDYVRYMSGNEGYYFEGVVELVHYYGFNGVSVKVNMDKPYSYFMHRMMTIDDQEYVDDLPDMFEIVGNVHENPELIKATIK